MKILYVCYSRTGFTERAALALKDKVGGESRYIRIRTEKSGMGFARALFQSLTAKPAKISLITPPPAMSEYDLVVLATPVWAGRASSPLRAFLRQNTGAKKVAVLATHMSESCPDSLFAEIDGLTGVKRCAAASARSSGDGFDAAIAGLAAAILDAI